MNTYRFEKTLPSMGEITPNVNPDKLNESCNRILNSTEKHQTESARKMLHVSVLGLTSATVIRIHSGETNEMLYIVGDKSNQSTPEWKITHCTIDSPDRAESLLTGAIESLGTHSKRESKN